MKRTPAPLTTSEIETQQQLEPLLSLNADFFKRILGVGPTAGYRLCRQYNAEILHVGQNSKMRPAEARRILAALPRGIDSSLATKGRPPAGEPPVVKTGNKQPTRKA